MCGSPSTNLLLAPDGSLFGTTEGGGPSNCGLVFQLKPQKSGALPWKFKTLATFASEVGCTPRSALTRDDAGNLYGALFTGGAANLGAAYMLRPTSGGSYKLKTLKSFSDPNQVGSPIGDIALDGVGAVIGAARNGGADGCGGVYRLAPPSGSGKKWKFQKVRKLAGGGEGCFPLGVARDAGSGALAVTTYQGGVFNVGALLELTPRASGPADYRLRLRESFGPSYNYPQGSPVWGPDGEVYGSTTDAIAIWRSSPAP
ncbi:choice-of-anchor tandem repeat GloVer-containing protein [Chenggangzhangella methanolivorans]|uniref:Uncharacterized protein n=1 Tax=Chenggangzhangella methanolivorans TaxID=1437009 RepID=A0A9E6UNC6_9HYPH|nr:choice-of-anchor tandem repeat GloVer-containing protein [Chenggangzhangella methanolivorans]QZO00049.1 hypothetical protein K6K41_26345 [Chenggangzhangella methanolivorans]